MFVRSISKFAAGSKKSLAFIQHNLRSFKSASPAARPPLFDIGAACDLANVISALFNNGSQLVLINFLVAQNHSLFFSAAYADFSNIKRLANRIIDMRFAHAAHHPMNLCCCFFHSIPSLSLVQLFSGSKIL